LLEGFSQGYFLDESTTAEGLDNGETNVVDVTFNDVTSNFRNDTGSTIMEGDFFSGIGNGIGADYDSWNSGWTRN